MTDLDLVTVCIAEFGTDFGNDTETGNICWLIYEDDLVFHGVYFNILSVFVFQIGLNLG